MDKFSNFIWKIFRKGLPLFDVLFLPFTFFAAVWFRLIRQGGIERASLSKKLFTSIGVFPIRDHYYEPLFNAAEIKHRSGDRNLPGIDLNIEEQLSLLGQFNFNTELLSIPFEQLRANKYYYNNPSFFAGDAEYLFNIIRLKKPRRIIEIGSGFSTLMTLEAIAANKKEDVTYSCEVICIEPYEMPWLEQTGVQVIRKKVQEIDLSFFKKLTANDILFIDSSHVIRPDGDVLFEYLQILPIINSGVLVHIHDIYTPADYPFENHEKYVVFINEQYLVEAFLSQNPYYRIIGSVNHLKNHHREVLDAKSPILKSKGTREPRSLWLIRN